MMTKQPPRSPGRPKQTSDEVSTYDVILGTASRLFMENGYEPVSLQQIAKLCNVTKASIYYHFTSKPELFKIAVTSMLRRGYEQTHKCLMKANTLKEGLLFIAEAKITTPHAEMETILREAEAFLSKEQIQEIRDGERAIHQLLADHFEHEFQSGVIKQKNPLLLAQAFSALLMLGNREDITSKYASPRELAEELVELFWQGAGS